MSDPTVAASLLFASAGASASASGICSLASHSTVFRASGPNVVVVDASSRIPKISSIISSYPGARVAGVAAAAASLDIKSPYVVAAALSDGSLAVTANYNGSWSKTCVVTATGGGGRNATPLVSVCALCAEGTGEFLLVSAAMDDARNAGLLVLWKVTGVGSTSEIGVKAVAKTTNTPDHLLPECVAMTLVHGQLVIALGGTDRAVRLYERDGSSLAPLPVVLHGHRDWVRGLCFSSSRQTSEQEVLGGGKFLLATGSTDSTVRVWSFAPSESPSSPLANVQDEDEFSQAAEVNRARSVFDFRGKSWSATLDALLTEHQGPVLSVSFAEDDKEPALITASMDGSVGLWKLTQGANDTALETESPQPRWVSEARFGLLGGTAATALGFSGAVFATPGVDRIMAHTLAGSVCSWRRDSSGEELTPQMKSATVPRRFVAECAVGGHVGPVNSVSWDSQGRFLMSCGEDKTTRVYVCFPRGSKQFVEWARPQVHGHPVRGVEFANEDGRSFVSIAEEKVLRLLDAPKQFILPGSDTMQDGVQVPVAGGSGTFSMKAVSAAVPELGLSNKAVYADPRSNAEESEGPLSSAEVNGGPTFGGGADGDDEGGPVTPFDISGGAETEMTSFGAERAADSAPLEVELRQHRLWPERSKLYGHGNDVACIAVELKYGVIASASRAQSSRDAPVILWDLATGVEKARLSAHDLTVNQLQFSSDGTALLSVSRDRSFAVFRNPSPERNAFSFSLEMRRCESHGRLLHSGCWVHSASIVATGSRDKHLKVWRVSAREETGEVDGADQPSEEAVELHKEKFASGVSALDATLVLNSSNARVRHRSLLAHGLEDGSISISCVSLDDVGDFVRFERVLSIPAHLQCCGKVSRLAWNPSSRFSEDRGHYLAASSEDSSTRVYDVPIEQGRTV